MHKDNGVIQIDMVGIFTGATMYIWYKLALIEALWFCKHETSELPKQTKTPGGLGSIAILQIPQEQQFHAPNGTSPLTLPKRCNGPKRHPGSSFALFGCVGRRSLLAFPLASPLPTVPADPFGIGWLHHLFFF